MCGFCVERTIFMCVVYLLSAQTKLKCAGNRLEVEKEGKRLYSLLPEEVECVVQGKLAQITPPALYELMTRGVSIFYVDGRGRQLGHLHGSDSWQRSRLQYECFETLGLELAREIVGRKIEGQRNLLRAYAKSNKDLELAHLADKLKIYKRKLPQAQSVDELMGWEGIASRTYFDAYPLLLNTALWPWQGRNRRPPQDPVNALLSFGYAFLEREVRLAILGARLDVRIGFLHSNNGRKDSLAFDLMEPFRQQVIDRLGLKSLNLKQFKPRDFSYEEEEGCRLSESARKNFIGIYETYMEQTSKAYEGLSPREWIVFQVGEFAKEIFRRGQRSMA